MNSFSDTREGCRTLGYFAVPVLQPSFTDAMVPSPDACPPLMEPMETSDNEKDKAVTEIKHV